MKQQLFLSALVVLFISTINIQAQEGEFHLDENYALGPNGTIYLNSEDAKVKITGSDRSDVHVKIDRVEYVKGIRTGNRRFMVDVEEVGQNLYIKERTSGNVRFSVGSFRTEYEIMIEMPRNGSLKIDGEDDDYVIRSVDGSIALDTEDGDIEIYETNTENIEARIEDGDLKIDGGKGRLYVDTEDGDVDVRNGAFTRLEIDIEDGTISIETGLADEGIYEINGDDAKIDFVVLNGGGSFIVSKDDGRVSSTSDFEIVEERENRVRLLLNSGTADVDIRVEDGRVRLSTKQ